MQHFIILLLWFSAIHASPIVERILSDLAEGKAFLDARQDSSRTRETSVNVSGFPSGTTTETRQPETTWTTTSTLETMSPEVDQMNRTSTGSSNIASSGVMNAMPGVTVAPQYDGHLELRNTHGSSVSEGISIRGDGGNPYCETISDSYTTYCACSAGITMATLQSGSCPTAPAMDATSAPGNNAGTTTSSAGTDLVTTATTTASSTTLASSTGDAESTISSTTTTSDEGSGSSSPTTDDGTTLGSGQALATNSKKTRGTVNADYSTPYPVGNPTDLPSYLSAPTPSMTCMAHQPVHTPESMQYVPGPPLEKCLADIAIDTFCNLSSLVALTTYTSPNDPGRSFANVKDSRAYRFAQRGNGIVLMGYGMKPNCTDPRWELNSQDLNIPNSNCTDLFWSILKNCPTQDGSGDARYFGGSLETDCQVWSIFPIEMQNWHLEDPEPILEPYASCSQTLTATTTTTVPAVSPTPSCALDNQEVVLGSSMQRCVLEAIISYFCTPSNLLYIDNTTSGWWETYRVPNYQNDVLVGAMINTQGDCEGASPQAQIHPNASDVAQFTDWDCKTNLLNFTVDLCDMTGNMYDKWGGVVTVNCIDWTIYVLPKSDDDTGSTVVEANIYDSEVVPLPNLSLTQCSGGTMAVSSLTAPVHSGMSSNATATGVLAGSTGLSRNKKLKREVVSAVAQATLTTSAVLTMSTYTVY